MHAIKRISEVFYQLLKYFGEKKSNSKNRIIILFCIWNVAAYIWNLYVFVWCLSKGSILVILCLTHEYIIAIISLQIKKEKKKKQKAKSKNEQKTTTN